MIPVLEAVPNFSEGRDLEKVEALVDTIARKGVDILDWSADPDHHRSVVTYIGDPRSVISASIAAAEFAVREFDLSRHRGLHPRIGALDVLPFVPLRGLLMSDAIAAAHKVGQAIASLGVPVFFYGEASNPPGRGLAELRRGGIEALQDGFHENRKPDLLSSAKFPHTTAGATCVGARDVLLAWNVLVAGIDEEQAKVIASKVRERDGGFSGVRALGLYLHQREQAQISMNIEDTMRTTPTAVYEEITQAVSEMAGEIVEIEVIGMAPDALVLPGSESRLDLLNLDPKRVLSFRVNEYVQTREGWAEVPEDLS